ncbi:hypothetical protein B0O80DRAFT_451087 [Mortierella sp. GBAus27b]|nr:hypothetical protein B0O80DRAFT_451087 [Mortierella sp. GBAus27b]
MFGQTAQQPKLQFPTNYHLQQQQIQQQQQQPQTNPMAVPMTFVNSHQNNSAATPNNSFAPTIDPGLLQMTMGRMDMSQLQNMNSLFPPTTGALSSNQALLGRGSVGNINNVLGAANNLSVKQETASPDYLTSEMDLGEAGNILSPGSSSPLNSPLNDFDNPDDFATSNNNGAGSSTFAKATPTPLNIHPGSFGESPNTGSLYSPGLESDFFPDGDYSLPKGSRPLDMKFNRMHPNSLPANPFHSMSMPVQRSEWFGGATDGHSVGSYENPSGLQFAPGEVTMMDSLFEDGSDPK